MSEMPSLINSGVGGLNVDFDELQGDSFNAHATPLVGTDLISGRTVIYNSVTPVADLEDVAFSVPPNPKCIFILNQTRLEGHFVVVTDNGEGVKPTDGVSITNHFCAALFSQIEVHLNGSQICDLSAPLSYAFKHHIDFVLSYNKNVLTNVGQSEVFGFCRKHDGSCHPARPDNMAMCQDIEQNRQRILNGKKVYFSSTLPADIFYTDKYLPPNVEISIVLRRFNTAFGVIQSLPDDKMFRIHLKELKLRMRKVLPSVRVRNRLNAELAKGRPYFLPFKDTQMKHYLIPSGSSSFTANHINNSEMLPQQIIFCMVVSRLFSKQPSNYFSFYFKEANLTSVFLKNNGRPLMPRPLECAISTNDFIEIYEHFQSNVGGWNGISPEAYASGQTFLAFDLTLDKCQSFHNHAGVAGNLELDLTFGQATDAPITLISYAIYNVAISIDNKLQVTKVNYKKNPLTDSSSFKER